MRLLAGLFFSAVAAAHAADSPRQLQVLVEPACPSVAPAPKAQASVLLGLLVETALSAAAGAAVDAAGNYLQAAASTKSVSLKGSAYGDTFYGLDGEGRLLLSRSEGCVVLLVPGDAPSKPWFEQVRSRAQSPAIARLKTLPQFYFEASFERPTTTAQHLLLRNRFLHVASFQESDWASRDDRNYAVAFTLRHLEDDKPFATATFAFDNLKPGTYAESQVIATNVVTNTNTLDPSLKATLNAGASSQPLPFLPPGAGLQAAMAAQQAVAAPYVKALAVQSAAQPLVLRQPEWLLRNSVSAADAAASGDFANKLAAFCKSLDKLSQDKRPGTAADARCPTEHLKAANDMEEARSALAGKLEAEWSTAFLRSTDECSQAGGAWKCTVKPPKLDKFAPFQWEAVVVETREANAFAKALATAFAANKEKIGNELQDRLLPSRRDEAAKAAQTAQENADLAYKLALLDLDKARAKLLEAASQPRSAQLELQAEVVRAEAKVRTAARAAGVASPPI